MVKSYKGGLWGSTGTRRPGNRLTVTAATAEEKNYLAGLFEFPSPSHGRY